MAHSIELGRTQMLFTKNCSGTKVGLFIVCLFVMCDGSEHVSRALFSTNRSLYNTCITSCQTPQLSHEI